MTGKVKRTTHPLDARKACRSMGHTCTRKATLAQRRRHAVSVLPPVRVDDGAGAAPLLRRLLLLLLLLRCMPSMGAGAAVATAAGLGCTAAAGGLQMSDDVWQGRLWRLPLLAPHEVQIPHCNQGGVRR